MASSSTSSSSPHRSRGLPRALLLAACIVLAGEAALAVTTPRSRGRHPADDVLAALDAPQPHRPAVLWGDSVTRGAIDPGEAADWLHDVSSTQAISMAGVYYTYRRLTESSGPPDVLVLAMIPESWANDLDQVFTPTYFESCFLRTDEMVDFVGTTGRYAQGLRMLGQAWVRPPSSQRQAGVREALNRLRGLRSPARRHLRPVGSPAPDTRAGLANRAALTEFGFSEISRLYLAKLAARTGADGTRLVLLTAALPRSVAASWSANGYLRGYEDALRHAAAAHAHVSVEPVLAYADYEDGQFYDPAHLMPDLRGRYGERIAARLRALLDAR